VMSAQNLLSRTTKDGSRHKLAIELAVNICDESVGRTCS